MHWVIHAGLSREPGFDLLVHEIRRRALPLTFVRTMDHGRRMVETDQTGEHALGAVDRTVTPGEPVYVVGTTTMKPLCDALGWLPGYVDAPTLHECNASWRTDALNADARFMRIADIAADRNVFVRPDADGKSFTGNVLDPDRLAAWRLAVLHGEVPRVDGDDIVALAEPKKIWSEYRCILLDGRYVTGSRYRTGKAISYSADVGGRIIRFAEALTAIWRPRRLMCIDVADTPEGLKAIEANAPSSAGLYAIDANAYVEAVSNTL